MSWEICNNAKLLAQKTSDVSIRGQFHVTSNFRHTVVLLNMIVYVHLPSIAAYNLSPQALNIIVKRYSTDGRISFDNFIAIAVRLRLLTGLYHLSFPNVFSRDQWMVKLQKLQHSPLDEEKSRR